MVRLRLRRKQPLYKAYPSGLCPLQCGTVAATQRSDSQNGPGDPSNTNAGSYTTAPISRHRAEFCKPTPGHRITHKLAAPGFGGKMGGESPRTLI